MSPERTTSHAQANWFARGWAEPEEPSPCWPSSWGAQHHSGLSPPLQAESDVPSPWLTTSTVVSAPLLLALCEFMLLREWLSHPHAWSGSNRLVQLSPVLCFLLFPQFFWHSWDRGDLGFQQTHEPHRKVGENSGSFWKTLDPQTGPHSSPIITDFLCQKSNAAQEDSNQPGKESLWKGFAEKPLLVLSNTSSTDLQIHTKS